ncbi:MAG: hypothetical protein DBX42_02740 [Azospirillum sp.]|nr:MAG: hypothetical protein DBX42_02740 [Azospirillum sp.]
MLPIVSTIRVTPTTPVISPHSLGIVSLSGVGFSGSGSGVGSGSGSGVGSTGSCLFSRRIFTMPEAWKSCWLKVISALTVFFSVEMLPFAVVF